MRWSAASRGGRPIMREPSLPNLLYEVYLISDALFRHPEPIS